MQRSKKTKCLLMLIGLLLYSFPGKKCTLCLFSGMLWLLVYFHQLLHHLEDSLPAGLREHSNLRCFIWTEYIISKIAEKIS